MRPVCSLLPVVLICAASCGSDAEAPEEDALVSADSLPPGWETAPPSRDGGVPPIPTDGPVVAPDKPAGPLTCPCPLDYLCNLATNTCELGCQSNESCHKDKYCDPVQHICKVGCRTKADCKDDSNPCTDLSCQTGKCVFTNNAAPCADDGNMCTKDVCQNGSCAHLPANEGKICGTTGECSNERCQAGVCTLVHESATHPCSADTNSCTADLCDGQGNCKHTVQPDGTDCLDIWPGGWDAKCFGGTCAPLRYRCSNYSTLYYHQFSTGTTATWAGTTGCGCSGKTMKWHGWYSGYFLEHEEYCLACIINGSTHDCYDLPPS